MPLLRVTDLEKSFGAVQAVKGVSFVLEEGRCTALLGPNGAGKTTALRMLAGLIKPSSGSIALSGSRTTADIRGEIGYLPQFPAYYGWMSGKEYLVYVGRLARMKKRDAGSRAERLLETVGLSEAKNKKIAAYSGGMRQRLGLAQAMMHRPRLLILDEPVSALDPIGRREVLGMMRALRREATVLFSTHVLSDAEEITDDLLIMNSGRITLAGPLRDVLEAHRRPVIRLRGEGPLETWRDAFAALDGVAGASCSGDRAELAATDRELARASLLKLLVERKIAVRKLEVAELSLEDIFMKAVKDE